MKTQLLDRTALIAMTLYIMGALSYYLSWFLESGAYTALSIQLFVLLPPVCAGAVVFEILRYRRESDFAPRWLAAAALGAGVAIRLAWELFLFGLALYNSTLPPSDPSGGDLPPEFRLALPYMLLCALLSVVAALFLPKLIWVMLRDLRKPIQSQ